MVDVDAEFVDNAGQLLALSRLIELHLVTDHRVEMAERLGPLPDQVEEVGRRLDDFGVGRHADGSTRPSRRSSWVSRVVRPRARRLWWICRAWSAPTPSSRR